MVLILRFCIVNTVVAMQYLGMYVFYYGQNGCAEILAQCLGRSTDYQSQRIQILSKLVFSTLAPSWLLISKVVYLKK